MIFFPLAVGTCYPQTFNAGIKKQINKKLNIIEYFLWSQILYYHCMGGTIISMLWLICKAKHPVKVHIWVGIIMCGQTGICIFDGIMDAPVYVDILQQTLVPFIQDVLPDGHRFMQIYNHCIVSLIHAIMQDSDPNHTKNLVKDFFKANHIKWWKSPDQTLIKNMWHKLKEFIG